MNQVIILSDINLKHLSQVYISPDESKWIFKKQLLSETLLQLIEWDSFLIYFGPDSIISGCSISDISISVASLVFYPCVAS